MTLKSLNTRYLQLIRKMAAPVVLLLASISPLTMTHWSVGATGFNLNLAEADNSFPALQDTAAITYLKEHKLYDSLRVALNATRTQRRDNSAVAQSSVDEQKLTASDGTSVDEFGFSVAVSGSTVVVGAPFDTIGANNNQGSAYVFNRQGGSWVETQKLSASDGASSDLFGISVAFSGSTIVVGAPFDNIGGNFLQGSAYVFNRQGSWVETQKLTASDGEVNDLFGSSVAVGGSTVIVGARGDDIGGNFAQGSAYIFSHQGGSWVEMQKLTASDGEAFDQFSSSVAFSGSTIVVGAEFDDIGANLAQGSVYVFNHQGGGWVETQKLTASDGAVNDSFGNSVAISGSTIVVGAWPDDIGDNIDQGSAYVFNRQGGSWVETQKLTASDGAGGDQLVAGDQFGFSVAISGSTIVVGAVNDTIGENRFQGSAYVFNRQGGSWVETQKLTASDGAEIDFFGWSVAVSGSTIVVGAPFDDIGGNLQQGSAYVFEP